MVNSAKPVGEGQEACLMIAHGEGSRAAPPVAEGGGVGLAGHALPS